MNLSKITNDNFYEIFNEFTCIVLLIIDKHAPVKNFSCKQKNLLKKSLITKAISISITKKRVLFETHF